MARIDQNKYWLCLIGPIDQKAIPDGADAPMRKAVKDSFVELTGYNPERCSSGWGVSKERADVINAVSSLAEDDELFIAIKAMLEATHRIEK